MGASAWAYGSEPGEIPAGEDVLVGGRYRLLERLGVQDGSLTWRAADEALNRPVMLWTFPPGFQRAGAVVAAARAACQLADRRLTLIFDADDEGEFPYVVGEWPPGRQLGELLLTAGPSEPASAAAMVAEAAGALAAAHSSGLAHLCLRPSSLWQGRTGEVKVSGLGIAAALAGIETTEPVRADTRGLGQLLYAALTGYWPGTEPTALPAAPRRGDGVYRPREVRAGISGQLDAVACRTLSDATRDAGPPIADPAQLADELTEAVRARSPRRGHTVTDQPAATRPEPAPVAAARWSGPPAGIPEPVDRAPGSPPPTAELPRLRGQRRRLRQPVIGIGWSRSAEPARRPHGRARRAKAVLAGAVILAGAGWVAAGGLSRAPHGTVDRGAGIGSPGGANPAERSSVLARTARTTLRPLSAQAFGLSGPGDNGQLAPLAIDGNLATAWQTDWYTSPTFGNLEPGTGLILDMGRAVTITGAQILLGSTPGAGFELRAGMSAGPLADLPVLASENGAGGWVRIQLSTPVHARYVLIWFTKLPADSSGTFQVSVFDVRVQGWQ
jgi:eukaryotic-like serine/threonine-protein kinase